jgi:hypothetical protein
MTRYALIYPMFALVLLSAFVLARVFRSRVRAVRAGKVSARYFRIYQGEVEPEETAKPARHFTNLFEAPTLFYAGCLAAMATGDEGLVVQLTAWAYVVARLVHAFIHLGQNRLGHRINAYFASWIALLALWVHVVAHVALRA